MIFRPAQPCQRTSFEPGGRDTLACGQTNTPTKSRTVLPHHWHLSQADPKHRVGGGVTPAVLPHHRTYGSVYGGSCLLTNSVSELGSVDVSPVVTKRPDRPSEFPTPTS